MSKNYSLAIFLVLVLILLGLVWFHTGTVMPPSGEEAIWFHAGLLTLLIGAFIIEYRFTRPNDVFVNCLIVFASTSTLSNPPNGPWWELVRWGALICGVVALFLAWDPGKEAKLRASRLRTVIYQIVTRIGRAEVIFSLVFILALISYFDLHNPETRIFAIIWGLFLVVANLDIPSIRQITFRMGMHGDRNVLGTVYAFLAPSIVYCRRMGTDKFGLHDLVGFCQSPSGECHGFGVIIGERSSAPETRVVVGLLNSTVSGSQLNDHTLLLSIKQSDREALDRIVSGQEFDSITRIIGTVSKGTNIGQVRFEIFGKPDITAGSLLDVKSSGSDVFYQVFDGVIDEEEIQRDSARAFVEGLAEQVGCWDNQRGGFETHDWVAEERTAVRLVDHEDVPPNYQLKETEMKVGAIPHSQYPVNIDLNDLVLYHTGILGVTGSGKSFLTFALIEEAAIKGIKTLCIDPTGDCKKYLANAVLIPAAAGGLRSFLNSPNHMIGIIETASRQAMHPILQTLTAAKECLQWCKQNRQENEILRPRPKVAIVLEEAHLLIPEWNFNPDRGLQDRVNETSQVVLQARKYGLGFVVVSQRTANVVKSILNQCNTIFSFQAFDETGFEFLRNYMGSFHVRAIPNLKTRHGILVGKASRSQRPIMVHFQEQVRALRVGPIPEMPIIPELAAGEQEVHIPPED